MEFRRGNDRPDPIARLEHRVARSWHLATGTLACPLCDAPVVPAGPITPAHALGCPYCLHTGPAREFLSLEPPARPARVVVTVTSRPREVAGLRTFLEPPADRA